MWPQHQNVNMLLNLQQVTEWRLQGLTGTLCTRRLPAPVTRCSPTLCRGRDKGPLHNPLLCVVMTGRLVHRCEVVSGWHLLGVSPWLRGRSDPFKSKREQGLGCSEEHPPSQARINNPAPLNAFAFQRNHNETKAELFSVAGCCVTGCVYDWAWILHRLLTFQKSWLWETR